MLSPGVVLPAALVNGLSAQLNNLVAHLFGVTDQAVVWATDVGQDARLGAADVGQSPSTTDRDGHRASSAAQTSPIILPLLFPSGRHILVRLMLDPAQAPRVDTVVPCTGMANSVKVDKISPTLGRVTVNWTTSLSLNAKEGDAESFDFLCADGNIVDCPCLMLSPCLQLWPQLVEELKELRLDVESSASLSQYPSVREVLDTGTWDPASKVWKFDGA